MPKITIPENMTVQDWRKYYQDQIKSLKRQLLFLGMERTEMELLPLEKKAMPDFEFELKIKKGEEKRIMYEIKRNEMRLADLEKEIVS